MGAPRLVVVFYTTLYREGGPMFARAAATLADERRAAGHEVLVRATESKADVVALFAEVRARGARIEELHFIGHAGMYGPMFRTTACPEQFSPHEWRHLDVPFAQGARAYFHACRSARWFAPFFARTFGVEAYGNHWYTTVSAAPDRFRWKAPWDAGPTYVVGCVGKKSHGVLGSARKYLGAPAERMKRFSPEPPAGDPTYDAVAELYDEAFADITVRQVEVRWIERHLPARAPSGGAPRVLDVGCGNGALLAHLAPRLASGVGVDRSAGMIRAARRRQAAHASLRFEVVDGPRLPLGDDSVDVVISMLSFRYLDWDPIMQEIRRVLAPGGTLLVVDMVTRPVELREGPALLRSVARTALGRARHRRFDAAVRRLVSRPEWKTMLAHNPIRAEHEFVWFLESRFPGRRVERLDVGWTNRVLAFDSGPLPKGFHLPQTYP